MHLKWVEIVELMNKLSSVQQNFVFVSFVVVRNDGQYKSDSGCEAGIDASKLIV